jgi:hypothetical protein
MVTFKRPMGKDCKAISPVRRAAIHRVVVVIQEWWV